jgi:sirohydrochlorin cobaltochelatase
MKRGVLLFAHGARDPNWALPFEDVARRVGARAPDAEVRLAFLEFMSPGIADAGHALAAAGCTHVEVLPLFLGAGGHVRKDLPLLLEALGRAHPQVSWVLRPAVGESEQLIEAMARIALQPFDPA